MVVKSTSIDRDPAGRITREETKTRIFAGVVLYQLIYSLSGLALGLSCVIGGIVLFLHGVTGATSWTAKFIGAESQITDAAPGAVLFIVGLFVVWVTRFRVATTK